MAILCNEYIRDFNRALSIHINKVSHETILLKSQPAPQQAPPALGGVSMTDSPQALPNAQAWF